MPDVVLMDLQMPKVTGFEAMRTLAAAAPDMRFLALTAFPGPDSVDEALRSGARGCVSKDSTPDEMVSRIFSLYAGAPAAVSPPGVILSRRELQLLKLVAAGLSNKQIARRLDLSQKTVRNSLSRVFG